MVAVHGVAALDAILGAQEPVGLVPHAVLVDGWQPTVPLDELVGSDRPSPGHRTHLGEVHTVPCDVVDLPRLPSIRTAAEFLRSSRRLNTFMENM